MGGWAFLHASRFCVRLIIECLNHQLRVALVELLESRPYRIALFIGRASAGSASLNVERSKKGGGLDLRKACRGSTKDNTTISKTPLGEAKDPPGLVVLAFHES